MKQHSFSLVITLLISSSFAMADTYCKAASKAPKDCNSPPLTAKNAALGTILNNIGKASSSLESFECTISYLVIQNPEIINSRALQTGKLYYQKHKDRSKLRIRIESTQQDDFEPEESIEDYYFDGVWLTRVNYKLEQIDLSQHAPEDKPVNVFELISHYFPLIGFSGAEALKKDFDISLVNVPETEPNEPIQLLLAAKKDSRYIENYKKIDFWINRNDYLPSRIKAHSTLGDIYDVQFFDIQTKKKLKNTVFTVKAPDHFHKNIQPLETAPEKKGH